MNRKNGKGDMLIDLTSVLDVIFILLLILICNNQILVNEVEKKEEELMQSISRNKASIDKYDEMIDDVDALRDLYDEAVDKENGINQYICTIYVSSTYNPGSEKQLSVRMILILNDQRDNVDNVELQGEDVSAERSELKNKLQTLIDNAGEDTPVILFLNYDDEKILYRDEKMISDVFSELAEQENVYIK